MWVTWDVIVTSQAMANHYLVIASDLSKYNQAVNLYGKATKLKMTL